MAKSNWWISPSCSPVSTATNSLATYIATDLLALSKTNLRHRRDQCVAPGLPWVLFQLIFNRIGSMLSYPFDHIPFKYITVTFNAAEPDRQTDSLINSFTIDSVWPFYPQVPAEWLFDAVSLRGRGIEWQYFTGFSLPAHFHFLTSVLALQVGNIVFCSHMIYGPLQILNSIFQGLHVNCDFPLTTGASHPLLSTVWKGNMVNNITLIGTQTLDCVLCVSHCVGVTWDLGAGGTL